MKLQYYCLKMYEYKPKFWFRSTELLNEACWNCTDVDYGTNPRLDGSTTTFTSVINSTWATMIQLIFGAAESRFGPRLVCSFIDHCDKKESPASWSHSSSRASVPVLMQYTSPQSGWVWSIIQAAACWAFPLHEEGVHPFIPITSAPIHPTRSNVLFSHPPIWLWGMFNSGLSTSFSAHMVTIELTNCLVWRTSGDWILWLTVLDKILPLESRQPGLKYVLDKLAIIWRMKVDINCL